MTDYRTEFRKIFDSLCGKFGRYEIFQDFVVMLALEISGQESERAKKYSEQELEKFARLTACVVDALDDNPDQDLMGDLFMHLELGSSHTGQFFTPYDICRMMAKLSSEEHARQEIEEKHWMTINEPSCGAGANLIAMCSWFREHGINYQQSVLFTAQDIDYTVGCMCYIQLSLLGCAGYVCIADTLCNPCVAVDDRGLIPAEQPGQTILYTPMYFSYPWQVRQFYTRVGLIERRARGAGT